MPYKDPVVIVAPAIDIAQLERAVGKANIVYEDATRNVEAAERKTESLREKQAQARLELGYALVDLKKGCRHGEWLPALARAGVAQQRSSECMRVIGHVEEISKLPTSANVGDLKAPTLRDAGIDKRPRKSDEQPDADQTDDDGVAEWQREIEARRVAAKVAPHSEFVPVFKRVEETILKESKAMYAPDRQLFAAWLRNVADEIDPLKGE